MSGGVVFIGSPGPVFPTTPVGQPLWPTPFGELRVASPWTMADLVNKYEIDARTYGTSVATGGTVTHVPAQSAIQLAVTASSGSTAKLRTHTYYRYQAGKALRWRTTGYHTDTGQAGQTREWGFFDENDGLLFQLVGTSLFVTQRSSTSGAPVDTQIAKASWNWDKMDGTGPSQMTLDLTKANIYEAAFQWLGVGIVQFFVNGWLVHTFSNPNTLTVPYMKTAQLPMSWTVLNTGASSVGGFTYLCASVFVEGGSTPQFTTFGASNAVQKTIGVTEVPLISIRPKLTYNSIENRMLILPFRFSVSTEGQRAGYRLVMNPTLTAASWSSADAASGVEFDVAATSGTGGQELLRGFLPNNDDAVDVSLDLFFTEHAFGRVLRRDAFLAITDILTLYAVNEGGGFTLLRGGMAWQEIR